MASPALEMVAISRGGSLKLPVGVIENIDRARKQCLWYGNDASKKGGNLAAWYMVQKPKQKGGLGVLNL